MILSLVLLAGLLFLPSVNAEPPKQAQAEINYLLNSIESSGCEFFRNGNWHDGEKAKKHLTRKYDYLAKRDQIMIAEDFIEKGASESSFSGKTYQVRCVDGPAVKSADWFLARLVETRNQGAN